jgi:hypothetical protein
LGNLATPENIQKLQTALHAKAKGEPGFRFYSLYDKVNLRDVLEYAYACCHANQGAAGVDGERFEDIETYGVERWLGELADILRKKTYRPQALRRVYVPKPNGKLRPLSIPTIRDRTVMMAATLILAPIFEVRGVLRGRTAPDARRERYRAEIAAGVRPLSYRDWRGFLHGVLARILAKQPSQYFDHDGEQPTWFPKCREFSPPIPCNCASY